MSNNKNYIHGITFSLINCLSLGILGVTAPIITMVLESVLLNYPFTFVQKIAAFVVVLSGIVLVLVNRKID